MEELYKCTQSVFDLLNEQKADAHLKFQEFEAKLDAEVKSIVDPTVVDRTPHRNKKKTKQTAAQNEAGPLFAPMPSARNSVSSHHNETTTTGNSTLARSSTARQPRQAAAKAMKVLKEPTLNSKMRAEVILKMERVSLGEKRLEERPTARPASPDANVENNPNTANKCNSTADQLTHATARLSLEASVDKSRTVDETAAAASHSEQRTASPLPPSGSAIASAQHMDESLIVMPAKEVEIVSLTDDEESATSSSVEPPATNLMMPPPAKPAPASRKPRTKKNVPVSIKSEKLSMAGGSTGVTEPAEPAATRSTRSKKPKAVFPIPIQVAATVKSELNDHTSPMATIEALPPPATNTTLESVYEDARADGVAASSNACAAQDHDEPMTQVPLPDPNATYVNVATTSCNATYVAPANGGSASNETYVAGAAAAPDETITLVAAASGANSQRSPTTVANMPRITPSMASIMTEDISDTDEAVDAASPTPKPPPIAPIIGSKYHKELFNPCIQSPLKTKVEAFERHAQMDTQSPAPVRQTRTKTRLKTQDSVPDTVNVESVVQKAQRSLLKAPSTPNLAWKSGTAVTPSTPQSGSTLSLPGLTSIPGRVQSTQAPKRVPSSVTGSSSKLAHLNRPASANKATASKRESSAEDVRRGLLDLAEEKRRKREEKLKQVQLQREQREKERADKYAKQLQEKEEKARVEAERKRQAKERKDREAESKRALEEIQRNIKIQALKDAEKARAERELLEAERKEREQLDLQRSIEAEKAALKQQQLQNKLVLQQMAKKKPTSKYTFDMLNTDDDTDDESQPKAGRPPPPSWSMRGNREDRIASQSYVHRSIIDGFASSLPMTPDLKEMFPDIREKHLRRNSSAVWSTPPRYSTMDVPRY